MRRLLPALLLFSGLSATTLAACPPRAAEMKSALKAQPSEAELAALQPQALALAGCLASPDPALRDGLAFELLSQWMRAKALQPATLQSLRESLLLALQSQDAAGVHAPFAALTLAEVARVDRLQPFLNPEQRAELLAKACAYLASVKDRRGYTPGEGWRHGVAHGADLLMQLSLNPALDGAAQRRILQAVASQVLAGEAHAYQFGEGQRLARPALFAAWRGELSADEWQQWLNGALASVLPPSSTPTTAELARLHNAREFLWPLYVSLNELRDEALKARLLPAVSAALKRLG
ncbi:DUF2785 domain-containing protein [Pelomonas sp. SE-A7]|uniref:DUF2785 domain-containing protein n=1 Tax=Pelomonas sp. SE-A7 TaxID=3054953 RepID=UPI00259D1BA1|nr:DUF2785 domain-containing protein [Pelomonas sp. SE-A7]MDM4767953.1 DUF2785 domain-containing protein [Pelomonas sp. SE-A7]